jgi:hypothetical protein
VVLEKGRPRTHKQTTRHTVPIHGFRTRQQYVPAIQFYIPTNKQRNPSPTLHLKTLLHLHRFQQWPRRSFRFHWCSCTRVRLSNMVITHTHTHTHTHTNTHTHSLTHSHAHARTTTTSTTTTTIIIIIATTSVRLTRSRFLTAEVAGYSFCDGNASAWELHAGDPNYNILNPCCQKMNSDNPGGLGCAQPHDLLVSTITAACCSRRIDHLVPRISAWECVQWVSFGTMCTPPS